MTRILILLVSLVLVGCPQQAYKVDEPPSPDGWCVPEDKSEPFYGSKENCRSSGGNVFGSIAQATGFRQTFNALQESANNGSKVRELVWCVFPLASGMTYGSVSQSVCKAKGGYSVKTEEEAVAAYYRQLEERKAVADNQTPTPTPTPEPTPIPEPDYRLVSTGTGFVVNKTFVVTADHVLRKNERGDACDAISIVYRKDEYEAQGVDADPANDLGLIKLSKPIESTAKLRGQPDLIQGEMAVNYGFPLMGELSTSAKVTGGSVNSLSGYNNNSSFLQYDAASQHGNSGGPVLDASGNVIGVVSSKLDDAETQLVNFATKSTILEGFLKANKVPFEKADLGEKLELPDIAEKAETFTVLVGCWE